MHGMIVQVRVADVAEGGRVATRRLATHQGRAHKMALSHDAPACFLTCGEDGQVMQHDLREGRGIHRKLLVCKGRNGRVCDLTSGRSSSSSVSQYLGIGIRN